MKVAVQWKSEETDKFKNLYNELFEEFKKSSTVKWEVEEHAQVKENESLMKRIENQNRNTLDIQRGGHILFEENIKFNKEVKHTESKVKDKGIENIYEENLSKVVTLAAGKAAGHNRETPHKTCF